MNEKLEQTIIRICEWIQEELKNASNDQTESILPKVIRALAELVRALAELIRE